MCPLFFVQPYSDRWNSEVKYVSFGFIKTVLVVCKPRANVRFLEDIDTNLKGMNVVWLQK